MSTTTLRKGQYIACKYKGNNGDLIVGLIESVRSEGRVISTNLLTQQSSLKKTAVLLRRNAVISKREAQDIVAYSLKYGKASARDLAVRITSPKPEPVKIPVSDFSAVEKVVSAYRALKSDEQQLVARQLWKEVLSAFGVA